MINVGDASACARFTTRCSCVLTQMPCFVFCASHAGSQCNNVHTRSTSLHEDENNDNDEKLLHL